VRIVGQHHEIRQLAGHGRGKDNMPSWYGILSDDEIEAIWAYVRATVDR
jgi:mono/diheme cytochrome c family protein